METKKGTDKLSDPGAYDHVHCDQFGLDHEGKPIADHLTGTGSDTGLKAHDPDNPPQDDPDPRGTGHPERQPGAGDGQGAQDDRHAR